MKEKTSLRKIAKAGDVGYNKVRHNVNRLFRMLEQLGESS